MSPLYLTSQSVHPVIVLEKTTEIPVLPLPCWTTLGWTLSLSEPQGSPSAKQVALPPSGSALRGALIPGTAQTPPQSLTDALRLQVALAAQAITPQALVGEGPRQPVLHPVVCRRGHHQEDGPHPGAEEATTHEAVHGDLWVRGEMGSGAGFPCPGGGGAGGVDS